MGDWPGAGLFEYTVAMERRRFEGLVVRAVRGLPEDIRAALANVDIVVAARPSPVQRRQAGLGDDELLLGLYEGVPQTERGTGYGMVLPDKITVFQEAVEAVCRDEAEIVEEVRRVVLHEVAHHFGIGDARLEELGL